MFPKEIWNNYPYPLAIKVRRVNNCTEDHEKFSALGYLFEGILKYLTAIAVAEYLLVPERDRNVQTHLEKIDRPSLGVWKDILSSCMRFFQGHSEHTLTIPDLVSCYRQKIPQTHSAYENLRGWFQFVKEREDINEKPKELNLENLIRVMVQYRNRTWGKRHLTADQSRHQNEAFEKGLLGLLQYLDFLKNYHLRYVKEVDKIRGIEEHIMMDYMGVAYCLGDRYKGKYQKEERLYLCDPQGAPQLSLHPFLFIYQTKLYFLEWCEQNGGSHIAYRECESDDLLQNVDFPSVHLTTQTNDEHNKLADIALPSPSPGSDGFNSGDPGLYPCPEKLLERLSPEGRRAMAVALGEAFRIGEYHLGLEVLFMALSRFESSLLGQILREAELDPGALRGALRGLLVIRNKDWRKITDVEAKGQELLPQLQSAVKAELNEEKLAQLVPGTLLTPRMMQILMAAAELSPQKPAGPDELFFCAIKHLHVPAVNVFFASLAAVNYDVKELLQRLQDFPQPDQGEKPVQPEQKPAPPEKKPKDQPPAAKGPSQSPQSPYVPKKKGILGQLGRDLTELARAGELRPAVGKAAHRAMVQMALILQQTQSNNPVLLGDPGVGKTAIVEGFAWRIAVGAQHNQPVMERLAGLRIVELPISALLAGTKYRGDLEEKLQTVLHEVAADQGNTIIFIDEIHTILAGKAEGAMAGVADILKPALARGEFPCIGATTVSEYRKYLETDAALARRFSPVWLEEPSPEEAFEIAKQVAQSYLSPQHHDVQYPDDVVREAVQLAVRYLHEEFLPGKVIKLLDQAGPRVLMGGSLSGLAEPAGAGGGRVTAEIIRAIVSERTGIPLTRLSEDQAQKLLKLQDSLGQRVLGQEEAVVHVAQAILRARAGLADPRRPLAVFLFAGPTGVGKTELALALAEALFDDAKAIIRIDMSEFMEKHQVARLIGAPPGYIGYEEEGQLTGRLRRHPYSVVLLDEIEKAHPDVQHLFLQLFDAGRLTDARGTVVDGKNAIFIMTTNLGAKAAVGFIKEPQSYHDKLQEAIQEHFSPEFLNRLNRIVYFSPLSEEILLKILDIKLGAMQQLARQKGLVLEIDPDFKKELCRKYAGPEHGARPLERAIENEITTPLALLLHSGALKEGARVRIPGDLIAPHQQRGAPPPGPPKADPRPQDLPEIDPETFAREFAKLVARLKKRGLTVECESRVQDFFRNPHLSPEPLAQALGGKIEKPLLQKLENGEFQKGDRVRISLYVHEIEFHKITGDPS